MNTFIQSIEELETSSEWKALCYAEELKDYITQINSTLYIADNIDRKTCNNIVEVLDTTLELLTYQAENCFQLAKKLIEISRQNIK